MLCINILGNSWVHNANKNCGTCIWFRITRTKVHPAKFACKFCYTFCGMLTVIFISYELLNMWGCDKLKVKSRETFKIKIIKNHFFIFLYFRKINNNGNVRHCSFTRRSHIGTVRQRSVEFVRCHTCTETPWCSFRYFLLLVG